MKYECYLTAASYIGHWSWHHLTHLQKMRIFVFRLFLTVL